MSETKEMIRGIAKTLRTLDGQIAAYIDAAVALGYKITRQDILSHRKVMEAVRLEVIRGLPSAQLPGFGDVKKSAAKLPG